MKTRKSAQLTCKFCGAPLTGTNTTNSVVIHQHQGRTYRSPITQQCRDRKKCYKRQRKQQRREAGAA